MNHGRIMGPLARGTCEYIVINDDFLKSIIGHNLNTFRDEIYLSSCLLWTVSIL